MDELACTDTAQKRDLVCPTLLEDSIFEDANVARQLLTGVNCIALLGILCSFGKCLDLENWIVLEGRILYYKLRYLLHIYMEL
jgi:hypothetical protein